MKRHHFAVRHPEPPINLGIGSRTSGEWLWRKRPTSPWINGFFGPLLRCAQGQLNVPPGTVAAINHAFLLQPGQSLGIEGQTPTLLIRSCWPPTVRSFLPIQSEPSQILQHGRDELRSAPIQVEIFVAQDQHAAMCTSPFLSDPERAGVTQVQIARGRRGDSPAVTGRGENGSVHHRSTRMLAPQCHALQAQWAPLFWARAMNSTIRVLVIEDHPPLLRMISDMLGQAAE